MNSKPTLRKKLILNRETVRILSHHELLAVIGGDSGGASAGKTCECTLGCSRTCPPPPQSYISCGCNESGNIRCATIG